MPSKRKAHRDVKPGKRKAVSRAKRMKPLAVGRKSPAAVITPEPEPPRLYSSPVTAESMGIPDVETSEAALVAIAQDAVVILRRELAHKALRSIEDPGTVSMNDCVALLRLTAELGAAARRGSEEVGQRANYDRLTPQQRVQLAALLLLVDYSEAG